MESVLVLENMWPKQSHLVEVQFFMKLGMKKKKKRKKKKSTHIDINSIIGCRAFTIKDPAECTNPSFFIFAQWINPAMTKDVCLSQEIGKYFCPSLSFPPLNSIISGRSGCRVYKDPVDILLWITDDEECDCRGLFRFFAMALLVFHFLTLQ